MKKSIILFVFLVLLTGISSVGAQDSEVLSILTYDSYSVSEEIVAAFETENNVKLQFIEGGDSATVLNRAILSGDSPIADVIIGINSIMLSRALDNDILIPYESPVLADIPAEYQLDPSYRAIPFNYGNVCLNYDIAWYEEKGLDAPDSWEDLIDPAYAEQLVVENPTTSAPGIAFLLATIAEFGEEGYIDYWKSLLDNKIAITDGWSTAYYTNFTAGGGNGLQPLVVSYDNSPAAVPFYSETPMDSAPTTAVLTDGMCYEMVEFLGILKGTQNQALAEKFVDAVIGKEWQEDLPGQMFVYPVNSEAALPEAFAKFAPSPENPVTLDSALIEEKRDFWLQTWNDEILSNY